MFLLPSVPCLLTVGSFEAVIISQWAQYHMMQDKVTVSVAYSVFVIGGLGTVFLKCLNVSGFWEYQ